MNGSSSSSIGPSSRCRLQLQGQRVLGNQAPSPSELGKFGADATSEPPLKALEKRPRQMDPGMDGFPGTSWREPVSQSQRAFADTYWRRYNKLNGYPVLVKALQGAVVYIIDC